MALAMDRTPSVCFRSFFKTVLGKFSLDGVAGAAHAASLRTAALDHKVFNDPVKDQAVVEALLHQA